MEEKSKIICPNCEYEFDNEFSFCPNCGQANKKLEKNIKHIFSEFLAANFNVDSKIFLTLRYLITRPAFLTHEYLEGRRTKYLTPIRLYLLISFVYFFVAALDFGGDDLVKWSDRGIVTSQTNDSISFEDALDIIKNDTIQPIADSINIVENDDIEEEDSELEQIIIEKSRTLNSKTGKERFSELIRKYISIGMFILIPMTALLFFWIFNKGTYYIQHLVFAFHLQSVIFIIFTISNIAEWFFDSEIFDSIISLLLLFSIYIWIKKNYKIGYFRAIWKMLVFFIFYSIVLILFFACISLITFLNIEGLKS